ncbi:hypothetical protein [Synechococcus sp. BIOS-U3-1]|nr:hypothetical protein [Synechococcus sp. BIOS-U3-1]
MKLQTFPCWAFTSQPTPFFGACIAVVAGSNEDRGKGSNQHQIFVFITP